MKLTDKYPTEKHYRPWQRVLSGLMAFMVLFQTTAPGLAHAYQMQASIEEQKKAQARFHAIYSDALKFALGYNRKVDGHTVRFDGQHISWEQITIDSTKLITGRNTFLKVAKDLRNEGGVIQGNGDLALEVGGTLSNIGGKITTEKNLSILADQINMKSVVHRLSHRYGHSDILVNMAEAAAGVNGEPGTIKLESNNDIVFEGVRIKAENGEITLKAGGNISIDAIAKNERFNQEYDSYKHEKTTTELVKSSLSAKDTIRLMARGMINIRATDIHSDKGAIEILAGQGIYIGNAFEQTTEHNKYRDGKWDVEQRIFQTLAVRSALDAGKKVVINTALGNLTLQATKLKSVEGSEISAQNGRVNFLMAKEQDHYFHHKVKKTFWKIKTDTKQDQVDTAVYNEIIGGVKVHATHGLTMEFGQKEGVTLDEMMDEFAENESLSWMNEVYNHPEFDGKVKEVFHQLVEIHKHDKTSSLSPAAMAIIAIAVACVMGPGLGLLGQGAGAGIQGAFGISQAAMQAGAVSLATQAVAGLALHNGDPFETMKDMLQEDSIKAVATAMVTAGVLDYMDNMEFFANAEAAATTAQAQKAIDIANQAKQVLIQSSVRAGINTAINGGDFSEQLLNNLKMSAINAIGEKLASKIGEASKGEPLFDQDGKLTGYGAPDINTLTRYLAHAGVGCLTGTLTSEVSGSKKGLGCSSGAGGAVIGELIADAHRSHTDSAKLEKELLEKQEEVKKLLVGEDGKAIDLTKKITPEERKVLVQHIEKLSDMEYTHEQLKKLQAEGVSLAKLGAGLAAFIAGADVNIAADAGENAAKNNAFWFVIYGAVLVYKAYSAIATAQDLINFGTELEKINALPDGPEKTARRNQLIKDIATGLALDVAIGKGAGAVLGKLKSMLEKTGVGQKLKTAVNKLIEEIEGGGPQTATVGAGGVNPSTGGGNPSNPRGDGGGPRNPDRPPKTELPTIAEHKVEKFNPYNNDKFKEMSPKEQKKFLKEYSRQLKDQQDAINSMTVADFKEARDLFKNHGRKPGSASEQRRVRKAFEEKMIGRIQDGLIKKGISETSATEIAEKRVKTIIMPKLAAIHNPDMVAGGWYNEVVTTPRMASVNSSIGSSWSKRIVEIDKMVENEIRNGNSGSLMNISLELARGKN